jgi:hypothetical protein
MTRKADFTGDEWATVVEAPLHAAMRVITAGRGGTIRESIAVGQTYAKTRRQHGDSELLDDMVSAPPTLDPGRVRAAGDISGVSSARLSEAVALLQQKASPEEVEAYKRFVLNLAEEAAHAHREGGRMGVGGEQVSESEQEALHQIAESLQLGPS